MNKFQIQKRVRKWHRYLGLILGIQFLFWTIGGLYFSWTSIESIRGEDLKNEKPPLIIPNGSRSLSILTDSLQTISQDMVIDQIQLIDILGKAHYQVHIRKPNAKVLLFNAYSLALRKEINEKDAIRLAQNSLKNPSKLLKTEYFMGIKAGCSMMWYPPSAGCILSGAETPI